MSLSYENCPHCFSARGNEAVCPVCGYAYSKLNSQPDNVLPAFTILNNRYLIGRCLGKGGFGITYSALDLATNVRCAIKEYFPSEFAVRNKENNGVYSTGNTKSDRVFEHAKAKFIDEARLLYQMRDTPNVVKLYNYFTENNTGYIVMEFLDGMDVRAYTRANGGRVPLSVAAELIDVCAPALSAVHQKGFLHRDLSPDNIFVVKNRNDRNKSTFVLIDFGAARNFIGNNAPTVLLKPGFAPPEAYSKTSNKGPWTDVYSLAATVYNILSGQNIIDALYRKRGTSQPTLAQLGVNVPKAFSDVIESALELNAQKRPQSMDEFHRRIKNSLGGSIAQQPTNTPVVTPEPPKPHYVGKLMIVDGARRGQSITLKDGQTIQGGRSMQSNDIVIDYISEISRGHFNLTFNASEKVFYLTDISQNGTFLYTNERLLKNRAYRIVSGQQFYLVRRDCMLMVKIEESEV